MGEHRQHAQGRCISDILELPPGFRFYPNGEEIITFYLTPKIHQRSFTCIAIKEVDLNRTEPWELADKENMGEEWCFFKQKDRKYPTGIRTNRATKDGYWKATGRDKEICRAVVGQIQPMLIGMKKTLVFYKGRAPSGEKTSWVMHEYRLEGNDRIPCPISSSTSTANKKSSTFEDKWVVCHVFEKAIETKKAHIPPPQMSLVDNGIDQSNIHMPQPLQFPMLPDFPMDPTGSYFSTAGMSSSSLPPLIPPMADTSSALWMMNNALVGNSMAIDPSMSFGHQMGMGLSGISSFMSIPESGPLSMVVQKDVGMSPNKTNTSKISPMVVSAAPESTATMGMDDIWEHQRS